MTYETGKKSGFDENCHFEGNGVEVLGEIGVGGASERVVNGAGE